MKKEILMVCSSSYQILVSLRVAEEYYKNDNISILITDTIAQADDLYSRLRQEKYFSEVYFWKVRGRFEFTKNQIAIDSLSGWRRSYSLISDCPCKDKHFDVLLYSNLSLFTMHLGNVLLHNNCNISIEMFEDGFSTYSEYTGDFFNKADIKRKFTRKMFFRTSALYVFNPGIMSYKPEFEIRQVHPDFKGECLELINRIFDYYSSEDDYKAKAIFFEESYFADGKKVDDVELVDEISEYIGKENIFIKIHPRNPTNRFSEKGYRTNKNISIPWEVVLINSSFENTVFITLASNAAMNPYFLFGRKIPAFLLFACSSTPDAMYRKIIEYDKKLCSGYPDIFHIPESTEQLKSELIRVLI